MFSCELKLSNGELLSLEDFKNNVLLVVNVASLCEHTHQYEQLTELADAMKDHPFTILAFPCNQFANQEPLGIFEIVDFCKSRYNLNFPLFDKVQVNGENAHPLFRFLTENTPCSFKTNTVKWNFTKFLVAKGINPIKRYDPGDLPLSITNDIIRLL